MKTYRDLPKSERDSLVAQAFGMAVTDRAVSKGHNAETSAAAGRAARKTMAAKLKGK